MDEPTKKEVESPGTHLSEEEQKKHIESMRVLGTEYQKILKAEKSSYYRKDGEIGYLISLPWLKSFERMVYFSDINYGRVIEFDEARIIEIGQVDNAELLRKKEDFWVDSDENSQFNKIQKSDLRLMRDFKVISETVWNFFFEKYGGTEIKRFYRKGYGYGAEIEATFKEVNVTFIPTESQILEKKFELSETKPLFYSKQHKLKDIKLRILDTLNQSTEETYEESDLRLWKIKFGCNQEKIEVQIREEVYDGLLKKPEPEEIKSNGNGTPNEEMKVDNDEAAAVFSESN